MGTLDFFFGYLNEDYPAHYHDCYEIHYILGGSGLFSQGGLKIPLTSDLLLVSPPGMEHVFTIDQEITFYYIRYKPDTEIHLPWSNFYQSYQLSGESRTTLSRLRILLEGDGFSQRAGEHLLLYFLYSLLGNRKVETFNHGPIIKSQNFMAENLSKKLTLRELADHVHLEKHYFCRLFKESTNISPLAYFEKLKMEAACSMIEQGTRGYRVAENLGFCDETYFCHRFKKVVGLSPGEFRRSREQGNFS